MYRTSAIRLFFALSVFCSPLYLPPCKAQTQVITTPRESPAASVSQTVGLTEVSIRYSRPAVKSRAVWGTLVPYGMTDLGYGSAEISPWRAGANENTVICFSTDVTVGGTKVKEGCYALFLEVKEGLKQASLILSSNTESWGSYYYKPEETVATINIAVSDHAFTEWLQFEFRDLTEKSVVAALNWENKTFPFTIEVDLQETVLTQIRNDMRGTARFSHVGPMEAANWCLENECNYEEALVWIDESIRMHKGFYNHNIKAGLLRKMGKEAEADKVMEEALPMAGVFDLHAYGRQLIAQDKKEKALEIFQYNAKKNPGVWPVDYGLARGYSAAGDYKKALASLEKAEKTCPDEINRNYIKINKEKLQKGEDIN